MTGWSVRGLSVIALFLAAAFPAFGQQGQQYSLYMFNRYHFNPAFGGMDGSLSINGAYRAQWLDLPGNPVQQTINAHLPFYLLNGALGIQIQNESIGAEKNIAGSLSYNYVLDTDYGLFSGGLRLGVRQITLDGTILRAPDGQYEGPVINHNDGNLPTGIERAAGPEFGAGIYYAGPRFEAGLAINGLMPGTLSSNGFSFQSRPTISFFGEYFIESFDVIKLYPTIFFKSDFVQTQMEVSVQAIYNDFIMGGVSLRGYSNRSLDALVIFAGARISEQFKLVYAYDATISALNAVNQGTHEISLHYNLNKIIGTGLPPRVIYNPRYLK